MRKRVTQNLKHKKIFLTVENEVLMIRTELKKILLKRD